MHTAKVVCFSFSNIQIYDILAFIALFISTLTAILKVFIGIAGSRI